MPNKTIIEIINSIGRKKRFDNPFDQVIVTAIISQEENDPELLANFERDGYMKETRQLILKALREEDTGQDATIAVVASRDMTAAELKGDRQQCVNHCRTLLNHIDRGEYPYTWALTHLKLGTLLAVLSKAEDGALLTQACDSLEKCLGVLKEEGYPEQCGLAHYNLALAYLHPTEDTWDDISVDESERVDKALSHGFAALGLMDQGGRFGNRAYLSREMVGLLILTDRGSRKERLDKAIHILDSLAKSPEWRSLKRRTRKELEQMREMARAAREQAGI